MAGKFFILENKLESRKIPLSNIYYFEKIKGTHTTCVVYVDGISTIKSDLREILPRLDNDFIQCHKSFIVNVAMIRRIVKFRTYSILHFDNNVSCPCSNKYRKGVLEKWKYQA